MIFPKGSITFIKWNTKQQDLSPLTGKLKCRFPWGNITLWSSCQMREFTARIGISETHSSRNRGSETQVYLPHFPTYVYLAPVSIHTDLILFLLIRFWDLCPCVCVCVFLIFAIRLWDQRLFSSSSKFPQYYSTPNTIHKRTTRQT